MQWASGWGSAASSSHSRLGREKIQLDKIDDLVKCKNYTSTMNNVLIRDGYAVAGNADNAHICVKMREYLHIYAYQFASAREYRRMAIPSLYPCLWGMS